MRPPLRLLRTSGHARLGELDLFQRAARVGAVVLARRGGDVSIGFNGFPMGVEDSVERLQDPSIKLELIVHAEQNALIAAGSRAEGATIFVCGKPVCARCAGSIIQAGISRVVAPNPDSVPADSKWRKTGDIAAKMFHEAGLRVDFYSHHDDSPATGGGVEH